MKPDDLDEIETGIQNENDLCVCVCFVVIFLFFQIEVMRIC